MALVYKIATPPAGEPLTVAEIREVLKLTTTDEDYFIQTLIVAAREFVEKRLSVALMTQTIECYLDRFPTKANPVELSRGPANNVVSVTYNQSGSQETWPADRYEIDTVYRKPRLAPVWGETWPLVREGINSIKITYVAGYGGRNSVPRIYKQLIQTIVVDWFQNRENPPHERKTRADYLVKRLKLISF